VSVWSQDAERANTVAARLEAGVVFINDFVRSDPRVPFGGAKASGFGRELAALGARERMRSLSGSLATDSEGI